MMTMRLRTFQAIAAALVTLALMFAPDVHADVARTGDEPWYRQPSEEARQRAEALFREAVDKHQQLLRVDAMELYEKALALWDNPDIRWNLALVLDDLGRYLPAHEHLESVFSWGAALGFERLGEVRERMRALETQRLARIEALSDQSGADIELDGQPWFQGAARRSALVLPGTHYIGATKSGYSPTTVSIGVAAGEQYRVTLRMVVDHVVETRRWPAWPPWGVVAIGAAIGAVGVGLEHQASVHRDAAASELHEHCSKLVCDPANPRDSDRAAADHRRALYAFTAGGSAIAVGLVLVWLNLPQGHRAAPIPSPVELIPQVSPGGAGVVARFRF
jgi:hypothetical protein